MSEDQIGSNRAKGSSEQGYEYQWLITEQLIKEFSGFATVTIKNAKNEVVTLDKVRKRGPDRGIDLIMEIDVIDERGFRSVRGKILERIRNFKLNRGLVHKKSGGQKQYVLQFSHDFIG